MIDIRMGEMPDPRINIRIERKVRDLALVCCSTSPSHQREARRLRQAGDPAGARGDRAAVVGDRPVGDPFAIHASPLTAVTTYSTTVSRTSTSRTATTPRPSSPACRRTVNAHGRGPAARASFLFKQREQKKLILLVTTASRPTSTCATRSTCGTTPRRRSRSSHRACYLLSDARSQCRRLRGAHLRPKGYMVVDHVNRLPERLPMLYAGLTR